MNQIFLGQPVDAIKTWFTTEFPTWPTYTTLKFVDGSTQTKEINCAATWENIGVKSSQSGSNNTLIYCQLGKNVTEINSGAFNYCYSLSSISIPISVTYIGDETFYACTSLISINVPNSVTKIGNFTFAKCSSLTSITIPNFVTLINGYAFAGCSSLPSITIPNSVTLIEGAALSCCDSLTSVIFENRTSAEITAMANYPWDIPNISAIKPGIEEPQKPWKPQEQTTLKFTNGTTQTKKIPGTATWQNIGVKSDQWSGDNTLTYCQLGTKVTSIGTNAFAGCSSLTSITIPNSVTEIKANVFCDCSSLISANIPNSVTSLEYQLFYNCYSLTSVTIPSSVTKIDNTIFYNCSSLISISIPASVTSMSYGIFAYCSSLTSVIFEGKTMDEITAMANYPWSIKNTSIIKPGIS